MCFLGEDKVFHLFSALVIYSILSLVSMTIVWAMIAHKGFEGLASSNSFMARLFRNFEKSRSQSGFIGYDFSGQTSNTEQKFDLEFQYVSFRSIVQNDGGTLGNSQPPNEAMGTCVSGLK
jgi:hypothetical protein